jgi:AGZA family xanthine/uracil permease-like MFS transporter
VSLIGWSDYLQPAAVGKSFEQFGLRLPIPSGDVWQGLSRVAPLLVTAIPLGIYNFTEAMNNVESASAAGDNYNLRKILLADGLGAIIGSILGSPFPPAVYIGHPGWKAVGGRIGYSLATGIAIALVCFLGLTALLLAVIPLVAILPILLYIGLVIGAQAFQASPAKHAPAIVLALIPNIAEWAKTQIDGALAAAGTSAGQVGMAKLAGTGVLYKGLETLGGGSVLAGMVLGATAALIIDGKLKTAAIWAFAGAMLAYVGLIHGAQLGWGVSPLVALGYAMFGATCLVLARGAATDGP